MNNKLIIIGVGAILVGGGLFYGGMKYDQNKNIVVTQGRGFGGGGQRGGMRGGATAGEILSKDDKSITVKLRDGGSKIVITSDATQIQKSTKGSSSDLVVGEQVVVMGAQNTDGSVSAQSIQIRANQPAN